MAPPNSQPGTLASLRDQFATAFTPGPVRTDDSPAQLGITPWLNLGEERLPSIGERLPMVGE